MSKLVDSVTKLLNDKNFAFLATLNKDGSPQLTPVWVDTDRDFVLVNTAMGRVKYRNMQRDRRVAVSLVDHGNPYSFTTIRGRVAEEVTGKPADDHIDRLAKKYLGVDKYPNRQPNEQRVILKITPDHVIAPQSM